MSAHTPGPWDVEITTQNGIVSYTIQDGAELDEEAEANANLIAAAPGLLALATKAAALIGRGIVENAYKDIVSGPGYAKRVLAELEAAIAKAEGTS